MVDPSLSIGRGQRQLIPGDRYTGKTPIIINIISSNNILNIIGTLDGIGTKALISLYLGINRNSSKLGSIIPFIWLVNWYVLILSPHSPSSSLFSYILPLIGISIAEILRDRGFDIIIRFDDSSKHPKSHRQIGSISGKIPSRDASPSDILNIHSSISERAGKSNSCYFNGSITGFPIIETIANDTTEHIATNIISITDSQLYTNKKLFLDSCHPAIDSALPISRIGSNAQCKPIKIISVGLKNELTNLRININNNNNSNNNINLSILNILYCQDYLFIPSINIIIILIFIYRNGIFLNKVIKLHQLLYLLSIDYFYIYHIISLLKSNYSILLYYYIISIILFIA